MRQIPDCRFAWEAGAVLRGQRAPRVVPTSDVLLARAKSRSSSAVSETERGDARLSVTEVMSHLVTKSALDLASEQVAI
jgi:hypothetical protein